MYLFYMVKSISDTRLDCKVNIPPELKNFFDSIDPTIILPENLTRTVPLSYPSVLGDHPTSIPREYFTDQLLMRTTEELSFDIERMSERQISDRIIIALLNRIFGKGDYSAIKKSYMINTATLPIKVTFDEQGKRSRNVLYIKKSDVNRMIGKFIYNLISGVSESRYAFNSQIFVEEGIRGNVVSRLDESAYLGSTAYREGVIKAAVHADFLGVDSDVTVSRNRLVDLEHRTILFDFNLLFNPRKVSTSPLLKSYIAKGLTVDDALFNVFVEEQHAVVDRIGSGGAFSQLLNFALLVGPLADLTNNSLDEKIRRSYGEHSFVDYIKRKIDDYSNA